MLNEAPHRSRVAFAGMAVARQRPATAHGIVFMLLEDELGQVNLIVSPEVYERNRAIVRGEPLLLVRGRFERIKENRNIVVESLESLGPLARRIAAQRRRRGACRQPTTSATAERQRPAAVSASSSRSAVLTRPMCENACGKLPTRRPSRGSYSSESRPRSLRSAEQPLEQLLRLVELAEQDEVVDEPEGAEEERALARRQAVDRLRSPRRAR